MIFQEINYDTDILFNVASAILGAIFGAFTSYVVARKMSAIENSRSALNEFINAFVDTKIMIENYTSKTIDLPNGNVAIMLDGGGLCEPLLQYRGQHQRALEIFRHYIDERKYKKIKKAYDNYYNPRNEKGSQRVVNILSFGIYKLTQKEMKRFHKGNISGKELALYNIDKILEAAKK